MKRNMCQSSNLVHQKELTTGARTTRTKQPAAKRQKNTDTQSSTSSAVGQPVLRGPHLSASSSSSDSEDEFDSF